MSSEIAWQEDHAPDFRAIHEALQAVVSLDVSQVSHTDWLKTVRSVRSNVNSLSFFIPNSPHLLKLLDTAEKVLLAVKAVENLARDAKEA